MARIEGVDAIWLRLKGLAGKIGPKHQPSVVVGYGMPYSVFVHENLECYHKPPTQAKFLEQPARQYRAELTAIVRAGLKAGLPLDLALYRAGLRLQRESLKLCPIKTGDLRRSCNVRVVV